MYVFLNNRFLPAEKARISVFDHGFLYGDGIYETLRTVRGKVFDPETHFERFRNSAKLLKLHILHSDQDVFTATEELLQKNGFGADREARIRWTLSRGANDFDFSDSKRPTFLITTAELPPYSPEYSEKGVSVTTLSVHRILPEAKTTALLPFVLGQQKCVETNSFECLFLESGYITEGTVSNFFILDQKNSAILVAPAGKILSGTAGRIFQNKMKRLGFQIQEKLFTPQEVLSVASEAFLTNSLFGILPVAKLENHHVGTGKVGEIFRKIHSGFWQM